MKTLLKVTIMMIVSLVLLVACGEPAVVEPTAEPAPTETAELVVPTPTAEREEMEETVIIPDELKKLVDEMKADLSERAEVNRDAITVVEVESVTWSDGALGCPEPDMGYTMALEPGYRLVLTVDGKEFHYHTRATSHFVYCENPQEPLPAS
ncbi:MAG: hypothetical protein R6X32_19640 [Chloroflexota bacterium]|jgi:hypothetical protein